jgi:hypothetical protein
MSKILNIVVAIVLLLGGIEWIIINSQKLIYIPVNGDLKVTEHNNDKIYKEDNTFWTARTIKFRAKGGILEAQIGLKADTNVPGGGVFLWRKSQEDPYNYFK